MIRDAADRLPAVAPAQADERTTIRVRGPWTPSTRLSSMSLVADGPLIMVRGRCGVRRGRASGTGGTTWSAGRTPGGGLGDGLDDLAGADDDEVGVWHQGQRAPALVGPGVQDDGAGLGDGDGA